MQSLQISAAALPTQLLTTAHEIEEDLINIINPVWLWFYRYTGEVFCRNPLHCVVQSAVDGKRQQLETFQNKLVNFRRHGFHFEKRFIRIHQDTAEIHPTKTNVDRQTDGEMAFQLYIVDFVGRSKILQKFAACL